MLASKKAEYTESKKKSDAEDQNNNDTMDEKPAEKTIFMDRILKLALEDKIFTEQDVMDELKTVLLAVSLQCHLF